MVCVLVANLGYAQSQFSKDYEFLIHLESISSYNEGLVYLNNIKAKYTSQGQLDTLNFYQAKFEYFQKNRLQSISFFDKVSKENLGYWNASKFYSSLQFSYLGNYDLASKSLTFTDSLSSVLSELKNFELAGIALLSRDFDKYRTISNSYTSDHFQLKDHQIALDQTFKELQSQKNKSPFVAGMMSAVIPGAGKFYLGKIGQGTMSLMTTGIFALQAYEGFRKGGPKSPAFLIFGGLFSVFYIGNIWGSVVAVRVEQLSINESNDETILLHMHIPMRLLLK